MDKMRHRAGIGAGAYLSANHITVFNDYSESSTHILSCTALIFVGPLVFFTVFSGQTELISLALAVVLRRLSFGSGHGSWSSTAGRAVAIQSIEHNCAHAWSDNLPYPSGSRTHRLRFERAVKRGSSLKQARCAAVTSGAGWPCFPPCNCSMVLGCWCGPTSRGARRR